MARSNFTLASPNVDRLARILLAENPGKVSRDLHRAAWMRWDELSDMKISEICTRAEELRPKPEEEDVGTRNFKQVEELRAWIRLALERDPDIKPTAAYQAAKKAGVCHVAFQGFRTNHFYRIRKEFREEKGLPPVRPGGSVKKEESIEETVGKAGAALAAEVTKGQIEAGKDGDLLSKFEKAEDQALTPPESYQEENPGGRLGWIEGCVCPKPMEDSDSAGNCFVCGKPLPLPKTTHVTGLDPDTAYLANKRGVIEEPSLDNIEGEGVPAEPSGPFPEDAKEAFLTWAQEEVPNMLHQLNMLNERVGQIESREPPVPIRDAVTETLRRVHELEERVQSIFDRQTIDQHIAGSFFLDPDEDAVLMGVKGPTGEVKWEQRKDGRVRVRVDAKTQEALVHLLDFLGDIAPTLLDRNVGGSAPAPSLE